MANEIVLERLYSVNLSTVKSKQVWGSNLFSSIYNWIYDSVEFWKTI